MLYLLFRSRLGVFVPSCFVPAQFDVFERDAYIMIIIDWCVSWQFVCHGPSTMSKSFGRAGEILVTVGDENARAFRNLAHRCCGEKISTS